MLRVVLVGSPRQAAVLELIVAAILYWYPDIGYSRTYKFSTQVPYLLRTSSSTPSSVLASFLACKEFRPKLLFRAACLLLLKSPINTGTRIEFLV